MTYNVNLVLHFFVAGKQPELDQRVVVDVGAHRLGWVEQVVSGACSQECAEMTAAAPVSVSELDRRTGHLDLGLDIFAS